MLTASVLAINALMATIRYATSSFVIASDQVDRWAPEDGYKSKGGIMSKTAQLAFAILLATTMSVKAEMRKLLEVSAWAAYGGIRDDGTFGCAMVTNPKNIEYGKLVIDFIKDKGYLIIRIQKPTWKLDNGKYKSIAVSFGYEQPKLIDTVQLENGLVFSVPGQKAEDFLHSLRYKGMFISFPGGTEPQWAISLSGEGFIEDEWRRCIKMAFPAHTTALTQP